MCGTMPWKRSAEVQRQYNYAQVLKKLVAKGDLVKARAYAVGRGLDMPGEEGAEPKPLWQTLQEAAMLEEKVALLPKRVFEPVLRQEHPGALASPHTHGIYDESQGRRDLIVVPQLVASGPLPPPGPGESVTYPDFKPARDPLPALVQYAEIVNGFANPLMRRVKFDSGEHAILWVTRKQGARIRHGDTVPVCENADNMQQGWVVWRPERK